MSNECVSLVQKRRVGSSTKKSVLIYLADRASDDGSGIWTSKVHIASDLEMSKRTVQNAMTDMERNGLLEKVGTRACKNGFTYEYRLVLERLIELPSTRDQTGAGDSPVQEIHPTGAGDSPHGVQEIHPNHPLTTLEPSNAHARDDLFTEMEETGEQDRTDWFENWWKHYPKNTRKANKSGCRAKFEKIIRGKHSNETPVNGRDLVEAVKAFCETIEDVQYVPAPMVWLNQCRWEPFLHGEPVFQESDLTAVQKSQLGDGICPPSMKTDGVPNAAARYWLHEYGHEDRIQ